jgi:hypothetical protein
MACSQCGNELVLGATACLTCGAPVVPPLTPAASPVSERVQARSKDALAAVKTIFVNPVGGLSEAFQSLEKRQALEVGIVLAVVFELCTVVGLYLIIPRWAGSPGLGEILKFLILGVVPFVSVAGAGALARQVFRGATGNFEGDIFIAGMAVLPFGFVSLLAGILGVANIEVTAVAAVFALSYSILILYTGCTCISGISQARAAPAVPIIILAAGWLSKILFAAML